MARQRAITVVRRWDLLRRQLHSGPVIEGMVGLMIHGTVCFYVQTTTGDMTESFLRLILRPWPFVIDQRGRTKRT